MSEQEREEHPAPEENVGEIHGYGPWPLLTLRSIVGGILMGLANLVPGVSGGTMLLASGIYPRFIQAIAEVSRFKFNRRAIFVLGVVAGCAALAIFMLAGTVRTMTVEYRWAMYSMFIGLTLGGVPVVWGLARPVDGRVWGGFIPAFALMCVIAYAGRGETTPTDGFLMMFLAGVAGASAMILPGISGGYLLLLLGVYLPILDALDKVKQGVKAGDIASISGELIDVVLPVGLGILVGVVVVSNVMEKVLQKYEKPTLGALLGLLVGSVAGLYPFKAFVRPEVDQVVSGIRMTAERIAELPEHKWPVEAFTPTAMQAFGAGAIAILGFLMTALLAKYFNRSEDERAVDNPADMSHG